ncbi:unnamed protein product [Ilex paraguariensis]|uniref:Wall-associated receptor kinase galacturonan-binding domain-containing protein n=1 Tax=Ilex paraguariensis TaxID=185542 RepID=A0ABC8R935_9AQUA
MMGFSAMLAQLITIAILVLFPTSSSAAIPTTTVIAKPDCDDHCGNVKIPYPFGMTKDCYLNKFFFINCDVSFNPPKAFLGSSNVNVTDIFLDKGQIQILKYVSYDCYDRQGNNTDYQLYSLSLSKFTVSDTENKFTAVGCDTYAIVQGFKGDGQRYTAGCMSICDQKEAVIVDSCSGAGCCQLSIPEGLQNWTVKLDSYYNHTNVSDFNLCSYAFVAKESEFTFTKDSFQDLAHREKLPLVLDWSIGNQTCEVAQMDMDNYACKAVNSICTTLPRVKGSGYICNCPNGYQGNPYLLDGCQGMIILDV